MGISAGPLYYSLVGAVFKLSGFAFVHSPVPSTVRVWLPSPHLSRQTLLYLIFLSTFGCCGYDCLLCAFCAFCALVCSPPVETEFPASAAFTHCAFCASLYGLCFILCTFPSPMSSFLLFCALFCIHFSTCQGRLSHWCRRWRSHNPWVQRVIVCQLCTSQQKHCQSKFYQLSSFQQNMSRILCCQTPDQTQCKKIIF